MKTKLWLHTFKTLTFFFNAKDQSLSIQKTHLARPLPSESDKKYMEIYKKIILYLLLTVSVHGYLQKSRSLCFQKAPDLLLENLDKFFPYLQYKEKIEHLAVPPNLGFSCKFYERIESIYNILKSPENSEQKIAKLTELT